MTALQKTYQIFSDEGFISIVNRVAGRIYQRLRPILPGGRPALLGGVITCYDHKWTDKFVPNSWLPWRLYYKPETYEAALLSGLNLHVRKGDNIVIVGGGLGVTATQAALLTGSSGQVDCFEGSREQCNYIRKTMQRNKVSNLSLYHAFVASALNVCGDQNELGKLVKPAHLPKCDILELDCEGSEIQILREMTIRPRIMIIETHGVHDAPTSLVKSIMEELGYVVTDFGVAEPAIKAACEADDVRVLVGVRNDHA